MSLDHILRLYQVITYITGFADWYSGCPETFAAPEKTAETVFLLLLKEILPS